MADYEAVYALLASTPGVSLRSADSREAVERYLERNPGLSFIARVDGRVAGCILSGHDGRRGYLQHLAVEPALRRQGIATALVNRSVEALAKLGIVKMHIDVLAGNSLAQQFWKASGWTERGDILRYSFIASSDPDA